MLPETQFICSQTSDRHNRIIDNPPDMLCPKCGMEQPESAECARCGLILAKWKPLEPPAAPTDAAGNGKSSFGVAEKPPERRSPALLFGCAALVVIFAGVYYSQHRPEPKPRRRGQPPPPHPDVPVQVETALRPVTFPLPRPAIPVPDLPPTPAPEAVRRAAGAPPQSSFEMLLDATPLPPPPAGSVAAQWREGASGYAEAVRDHNQAEAPLLVYFYDSNCPGCDAVQAALWADISLDAALRPVARVRINAGAGDAERALSRQFNGAGPPACFMAPARSSLARKIACPAGMTAQEFSAEFKRQSEGEVDRLVQQGASKAGNQAISEAIALLNQALELNPRGREAYHWRGVAHAKAGARFEAQADLLRAIKLDPHRLESYQELHDLWLQDKRYDDMIAEWNYFLHIEPGNAWGYLERSGTWQFKGEMARALEDARMSCNLNESQGCRVASLLRSGHS
jgi:tetratricopeptide (TPR) repeat protein